MKPRLMPLKNVKNAVRSLTEGCDITFYKKTSGSGFYLYFTAAIEGRTETVETLCHGLAHMYRNLFHEREMEATTAIYPEAKPFLFAHPFEQLTGLKGVVTRKKEYSLPNQIEITVKTPYGVESKMYCIGLKETDAGLLIVDDTISGGWTLIGHIKAFEELGKNVLGGISAYERGNGLETARRECPGKILGGFARVEIAPRPDKEKELENALGTEGDIVEGFLSRLQGDLTDEEFLRKRKEFVPEITEYLQPYVTGFFDDSV